MNVEIPFNAVAGAAVLLICVAVGILAKAAHVLEAAGERLRDFNDGIQDLRVATVSLRSEVGDLRDHTERLAVVQSTRLAGDRN